MDVNVTGGELFGSMLEETASEQFDKCLSGKSDVSRKIFKSIDANHLTWKSGESRCQTKPDRKWKTGLLHRLIATNIYRKMKCGY